MIALSVRGPWWWFILHKGKPVENRGWEGRYLAVQMAILRRSGGQCLLHASSGCTKTEYEEACEDAESIGVTEFPAFATMLRGGLVGRMELGDFVTQSASPWWAGGGAIEIKSAEPIEFIPYVGTTGFFTVSDRLIVPIPKLARGVVVIDYRLPRGRKPAPAPVASDQVSLFPEGGS
jgi:hypothetical protein